MSAWLPIVLLSLAALAVLVPPLLRRHGGEDRRLDADLAVYRDQLAEVERDLDQGHLSGEQAEDARREIKRRILRASRQLSAEGDPQPTAIAGLAATAAIVLLIGAAVLLYSRIGAPGLPSRPTEAAVEARSAEDREIEAMAAKLAARLEQEPGDVRGWALLGRTYATLNRHSAAARAFTKAVALEPQNASLHANLGEMLTTATGGTVGSAALVAFRKARDIDPTLAAPRYYLGLYELQQGKPQAAYDKWLRLYKELDPDDGARQLLRQALSNAAKQLGIDPQDDLGPAGPDQEDVAAAKNMSPADRQEFIESMVARLAERMKSEPDNLAGWLRLARAYGVLKDWPNAAKAYGEAARLKNDDPRLLAAWAQAVLNQSPNDPVPDQAIDIYRRIHELEPEHGEALWFLGLRAAYDRDKELTLYYWQRLLSLIPAGTQQRETLLKAIERVEKGLQPF